MMAGRRRIDIGLMAFAAVQDLAACIERKMELSQWKAALEFVEGAVFVTEAVTVPRLLNPEAVELREPYKDSS
jgi:hypothetical protein